MDCSSIGNHKSAQPISDQSAEIEQQTESDQEYQKLCRADTSELLQRLRNISDEQVEDCPILISLYATRLGRKYLGGEQEQDGSERIEDQPHLNHQQLRSELVMRAEYQLRIDLQEHRTFLESLQSHDTQQPSPQISDTEQVQDSIHQEHRVLQALLAGYKYVRGLALIWGIAFDERKEIDDSVEATKQLYKTLSEQFLCTALTSSEEDLSEQASEQYSDSFSSSDSLPYTPNP